MTTETKQVEYKKIFLTFKDDYHEKDNWYEYRDTEVTVQQINNPTVKLEDLTLQSMEQGENRTFEGQEALNYLQGLDYAAPLVLCQHGSYDGARLLKLVESSSMPLEDKNNLKQTLSFVGMNNLKALLPENLDKPVTQNPIEALKTQIRDASTQIDKGIKSTWGRQGLRETLDYIRLENRHLVNPLLLDSKAADAIPHTDVKVTYAIGQIKGNTINELRPRLQEFRESLGSEAKDKNKGTNWILTADLSEAPERIVESCFFEKGVFKDKSVNVKKYAQAILESVPERVQRYFCGPGQPLESTVDQITQKGSFLNKLLTKQFAAGKPEIPLLQQATEEENNLYGRQVTATGMLLKTLAESRMQLTSLRKNANELKTIEKTCRGDKTIVFPAKIGVANSGRNTAEKGLNFHGFTDEQKALFKPLEEDCDIATVDAKSADVVFSSIFTQNYALLEILVDKQRDTYLSNVYRTDCLDQTEGKWVNAYMKTTGFGQEERFLRLPELRCTPAFLNGNSEDQELQIQNQEKLLTKVYADAKSKLKTGELNPQGQYAARKLMDIREKAKPLTLGLSYGQGKSRLAESLGIPEQEAENLVKNVRRESKFQKTWDELGRLCKTRRDHTGLEPVKAGEYAIIIPVQKERGGRLQVVPIETVQQEVVEGRVRHRYVGEENNPKDVVVIATAKVGETQSQPGNKGLQEYRRVEVTLPSGKVQVHDPSKETSKRVSGDSIFANLCQGYTTLQVQHMARNVHRELSVWDDRQLGEDKKGVKDNKPLPRKPQIITTLHDDFKATVPHESAERFNEICREKTTPLYPLDQIKELKEAITLEISMGENLATDQEEHKRMSWIAQNAPIIQNEAEISKEQDHSSHILEIIQPNKPNQGTPSASM